MAILDTLKTLRDKMVADPLPPDRVAAGWALGMFIGCAIPFGVQLVVSVPLAILLRITLTSQQMRSMQLLAANTVGRRLLMELHILTYVLFAVAKRLLQLILGKTEIPRQKPVLITVGKHISTA